MSKTDQKVLSSLRQMIISGELEADKRVAEIPTAELLGVSRTPVRIAFRALEQEGLLIRQERRGYRVRKVDPVEIGDAIEVRGVLEGLAARQAAETGLSPAQRETLISCLEQGDQIFNKGYMIEEDLEIYHSLNQRFHEVIIEASGNAAIRSAMARNEHLPFASVNSIAVDRKHLDQEYRRFNFAHMQHHSAFDAIDKRQGSRAESIMREHANVTLRDAQMFADRDNVEIIGSDSAE